ncbi:hypothetical protein [Teredinibacter sp. KSP-S5-2]|uniref:hypothetical protein n=1 Tax=Teredinibacter sp. KSP-S5-2 TaxID=3034506 RepID=UPI0029350F80|nr:hypothetical protein [Teredinibacter sp. KSP-S5-2]WNO09317.1 hypothetical protein P5V12_20445 [Teredinibacter sp. KSP-S5-2]
MSKFRKPINNRALRAAIICIPLLFSSVTHAEAYLYRYLNDKGVKEIGHAIPPEYAQNGYEVLNRQGQVIKVVEPAPTNEEIAIKEEQRLAQEQYAILKRRYSSTADIESAKRRKLANLETNIAILRGNINSVQSTIDGLMTKAANIERQGRQIPANILQELTDAKAELTVAQEMLDIRLNEYKEISEKFDKDVAAFIKGAELEPQQ